MKAIPTTYNHITYRSRLEARWAVYFTQMGFEFYYEFEGFDLDNAGWYLPDFYLPRVKMWAEVKPFEFTDTELTKLKALVTFTQKPGLMLVGPPARQPYSALVLDCWCSTPGLCEYDFILSNYHEYYTKENRFYGAPAEGEVFDDNFDDINLGINVALSAKF